MEEMRKKCNAKEMSLPTTRAKLKKTKKRLKTLKEKNKLLAKGLAKRAAVDPELEVSKEQFAKELKVKEANLLKERKEKAKAAEEKAQQLQWECDRRTPSGPGIRKDTSNVAATEREKTKKLQLVTHSNPVPSRAIRLLLIPRMTFSGADQLYSPDTMHLHCHNKPHVLVGPRTTVQK
eukprot:TRINITY_DN66649_c7_g1_i1.p2 TRINITY_DN66649_c7_g1~~TRINITY_DN66649_c7_g1_i1.p2  ORF type:complete len:178 (-),score=15.66 TRINITY_DN66649_c7_g1_i1:426-959(-)